MKSMLITIVLTALITAGIVLGVQKFIGNGLKTAMDTPVAATGGQDQSQDRKIIYWRAPMDPMEIYDGPGKSKMGMDLVPVYEDEVSGGSDSKERKIAYWRAPMDPTEIYERPGKSKMGMDLVPVFEDEIVGGVDIKIDPVVQQNMGLRTDEAVKVPLHHTIKTYGHITFDETRTGVVSQKAAGWIEKLYADYTGFRIQKGEPLYEIYSPSLLASQEEYLSAFKNYTKSRTPLNQEILDSARKRLTYYDIAPQEIKSLEETREIRKSLVVRSPFTGVVTQKKVVEGSYIKAGDHLYTISDLSHVWVEAHIFEYEQNLVFEGQAVEMTLTYQPEKLYRGKVAYVFPYLQPKTRDVVIRIDFENPEAELKPDMFANIKISTGADRKGLAIPAEAVIHSGEKQIVFVTKGDGRFTPREVKTGIFLDDGKVEVLTGLAEHDRVVTSGQFLLDSESKMKEAIQKMMAIKSAPAAEEDTFFDDMESEDAFFDGMEAEDDFFKDMDKEGPK